MSNLNSINSNNHFSNSNPATIATLNTNLNFSTANLKPIPSLNTICSLKSKINSNMNKKLNPSDLFAMKKTASLNSIVTRSFTKRLYGDITKKNHSSTLTNLEKKLTQRELKKESMLKTGSRIEEESPDRFVYIDNPGFDNIDFSNKNDKNHIKKISKMDRIDIQNRSFGSNKFDEIKNSLKVLKEKYASVLDKYAKMCS